MPAAHGDGGENLSGGSLIDRPPIAFFMRGSFGGGVSPTVMAAKRGPKPLPGNVHLINGNPSKKRLGALIDGAQVPVEVPDPPSHLSDEALCEWRRISVELEKLGVIAKVDRAALGVYCQAYGRWAQAEKKLGELGDDGIVEKTPSGYKQIGVWLQVSNRAVEQMHKFLAEFGMTPSSRSRVTINPQFDLFDDGAKPKKPGTTYFTK